MANGDTFSGRIPHFFDLLGQLPTSIPIQSQWVLIFQGFPTDLINRVGRYEAYEKADPSTSWRNVQLFTDVETSAPLQLLKGCVFAQKINTPSEGIDYIRVGENYKGGYVKGPVTGTRADFNTFDASFLETNLSFADMVLRPWSIMAAHQGLFAREADTVGGLTPRNGGLAGIKTNISIYHLGKAGAGIPPIVRKLYNFYECVPISVDSESYSYITDEMVLRNVSFLYSYYTSDADPNIVR